MIAKRKHIPTLEECAELHPGKAIQAYIEYAEINTEELAEALAMNPDDLETIIASAWNWHKNHPNGFDK